MYDLLCLFFFLEGFMESDALVTLTHDNGFCDFFLGLLDIADRTGFWVPGKISTLTLCRRDFISN